MLDRLGLRATGATGQIMEFRVWTELIQQSRGLLHVFLPLLDRGIDGVVHRLTDGEYIAVQVKSRTAARNGMVNVMIPGKGLPDDGPRSIAGLRTAQGWGPTLLVIYEVASRRLAAGDVEAL